MFIFFSKSKNLDIVERKENKEQCHLVILWKNQNKRMTIDSNNVKFNCYLERIKSERIGFIIGIYYKYGIYCFSRIWDEHIGLATTIKNISSFHVKHGYIL